MKIKFKNGSELVTNPINKNEKIRGKGVEAETEKEKDYLTLKWGTLKSWKISSEEGVALIEKYDSLGYSVSAMGQKDTPEQKQIICRLIDIVPGKIFLDWSGKYVSKSKAKKYVLEYGELPKP